MRSSNTVSILPADIISHGLLPFLNDREVSEFSSTAKKFHDATRKYWQEKLLALGLYNKLLEQVNIHFSHIPLNYIKLYDVVRRLPDSDKFMLLEPWELYCLSGQIQFFDATEEKITDLINQAGATPLHYVALSGSTKALEYVIAKNMNPFAKDNRDRTVIHYAALSGSHLAFNYVVRNVRHYKFDDQVLYHAAVGGSIEVIDYVLASGVDIQNTTSHDVARSGSVAAFQHIMKMRKHPRSAPILAMNAAESGSTSAMKAICPGSSFDHYSEGYGDTLLHHAARSGSVAAIECALKLYPDTNPFSKYKLSSSVSEKGITVLHAAGQSGSVPVLKRILNIPGMNEYLLEETKDGRNVLHFIAISGSVHALQYLLNEFPHLVNHLIHRKKKSSITPLEYLAKSGSVAILKYALELPIINNQLLVINDKGDTLLLNEILPRVIKSRSLAALKYILGFPGAMQKLACADHSGKFSLLYMLLCDILENSFVTALKYVLELPKINEKFTPQPSLENPEIKESLTLPPSIIRHIRGDAAVEMLQYLIEVRNMSSLLERDSNGLTAFDYAIKSGSTKAVWYLHSINKSHYSDGMPWFDNGKLTAMEDIQLLVNADLRPFQTKAWLTKLSLGSGAVIFGCCAGLTGLGTFTGPSAALILSVGCAGAIGVLLIALMVSCVRNRKIGFFEPSPDRFDDYKPKFPSALAVPPTMRT